MPSLTTLYNTVLEVLVTGQRKRKRHPKQKEATGSLFADDIIYKENLTTRQKTARTNQGIW